MKISWRILLLWTLPLLMVCFFLWQGQFLPASEQLGNSAANKRITYGRFLEYLDTNRVAGVDLYEGGRTAIVEIVNPELKDQVQQSRVD